MYNADLYTHNEAFRFSPALAYKFGNLSVGLAYDLGWMAAGYHTFNFQAANQDIQFGHGATLSLMYETDHFSFGLSYESLMDFKPMQYHNTGCPDGYFPIGAGGCINPATGEVINAGFVEGTADLDMPSSLTVGAGYSNGAWTLGLDVARVKWDDVLGEGQPLSTYPNYVMNFNWDNQIVLKLGVQYQASNTLFLRFGANHSNNTVPSEDALVTLSQPKFSTTHLTGGVGWQITKRIRKDASLMVAPKKELNGSNDFAQFIAFYEISEEQRSLDVGFTANF